MFTTIKDFVKCWKQESDATLKIFHSLTDNALQQKVIADGRTLGRLANHIIETLIEMPNRLGIIVNEEIKVYTTQPELMQAYTQVSENLLLGIQTKWNDQTLEEERNMYGEQWKNSFSLWILILHQTHHRGQMTVLMRQAGLVVPGVYGPSKEEWSNLNMPAMN